MKESQKLNNRYEGNQLGGIGALDELLYLLIQLPKNQIFALKATLAGFDIKLDRTNICQGEVHHDRPKDWEERHANKGFLNEKIKEYAKKFKPL